MFDLWLAIAAPFFIGLAVSFGFEFWLQPKVLPFWQRHWPTIPLHLGLYVLVYAFELALFQRPWFAGFNVLALIMLIVQVSNAKFTALREPFIYQDFEYFTDTLKYPRLYIPFFGIWPAICAVLGFVGLVYLGMTLETALTVAFTPGVFIAALLSLSVLGYALVRLGASQHVPVCFDPATDVRQLGLLASLWRYGEQERLPQKFSSLYDGLQAAVVADVALPNIVVVQSESFFDARRLYAGIKPSVLQAFDRLKAEALCQGQLTVSAWGANTVRTEFAFLTGLAAEQLGVHRFNPYRTLARQGTPSLARFLQAQGYRTVCVHPFHAGFYGRDQVMPALGFDEFIDQRQFTPADQAGPYIGDVALAEKVCSILAASSQQPLFVFVISMENHGPLHLEKLQEGDLQQLYNEPPPAHCADLSIYLRHLQNADRMAARLRECLSGLERPSCLCWYGDHVPIMPSVYQVLSVPDGKTDYFIWHSQRRSGKAQLLDGHIERLGYGLLAKIGLLRQTETGDESL